MDNSKSPEDASEEPIEKVNIAGGDVPVKASMANYGRFSRRVEHTIMVNNIRLSRRVLAQRARRQKEKEISDQSDAARKKSQVSSSKRALAQRARREREKKEISSESLGLQSYAVKNAVNYEHEKHHLSTSPHTVAGNNLSSLPDTPSNSHHQPQDNRPPLPEPLADSQHQKQESSRPLPEPLSDSQHQKQETSPPLPETPSHSHHRQQEKRPLIVDNTTDKECAQTEKEVSDQSVEKQKWSHISSSKRALAQRARRERERIKNSVESLGLQSCAVKNTVSHKQENHNLSTSPHTVARSDLSSLPDTPSNSHHQSRENRSPLPMPLLDSQSQKQETCSPLPETPSHCHHQQQEKRPFIVDNTTDKECAQTKKEVSQSIRTRKWSPISSSKCALAQRAWRERETKKHSVESLRLQRYAVKHAVNHEQEKHKLSTSPYTVARDDLSPLPDTPSNSHHQPQENRSPLPETLSNSQHQKNETSPPLPETPSHSLHQQQEKGPLIVDNTTDKECAQTEKVVSQNIETRKWSHIYSSRRALAQRARREREKKKISVESLRIQRYAVRNAVNHEQEKHNISTSPHTVARNNLSSLSDTPSNSHHQPQENRPPLPEPLLDSQRQEHETSPPLPGTSSHSHHRQQKKRRRIVDNTTDKECAQTEKEDCHQSIKKFKSSSTSYCSKAVLSQRARREREKNGRPQKNTGVLSNAVLSQRAERERENSRLLQKNLGLPNHAFTNMVNYDRTKHTLSSLLQIVREKNKVAGKNLRLPIYAVKNLVNYDKKEHHLSSASNNFARNCLSPLPETPSHSHHQPQENGLPLPETSLNSHHQEKEMSPHLPDPETLSHSHHQPQETRSPPHNIPSRSHLQQPEKRILVPETPSHSHDQQEEKMPPFPETSSHNHHEQREKRPPLLETSSHSQHQQPEKRPLIVHNTTDKQSAQREKEVSDQSIKRFKSSTTSYCSKAVLSQHVWRERKKNGLTEKNSGLPSYAFKKIVNSDLSKHHLSASPNTEKEKKELEVKNLGLPSHAIKNVVNCDQRKHTLSSLLHPVRHTVGEKNEWAVKNSGLPSYAVVNMVNCDKTKHHLSSSSNIATRNGLYPLPETPTHSQHLQQQGKRPIVVHNMTRRKFISIESNQRSTSPLNPPRRFTLRPSHVLVQSSTAAMNQINIDQNPPMRTFDTSSLMNHINITYGMKKMNPATEAFRYKGVGAACAVSNLKGSSAASATQPKGKSTQGQVEERPLEVSNPEIFPRTSLWENSIFNTSSSSAPAKNLVADGTANTPDSTLAGGSTSSTVILGPGSARDALDSSPCAAVSPAANISSFKKAEAMMRRPSLAKLKVRRGIRSDSAVVGASSQSLNTAPLSSISALPRPSSLGPASATSEVAMGNTSWTDERIGSGGTTQELVSPLSDRDPLPHISKYNRTTGSTESNNLGKPAVQCSPDGSSSLYPNEAGVGAACAVSNLKGSSATQPKGKSTQGQVEERPLEVSNPEIFPRTSLWENSIFNTSSSSAPAENLVADDTANTPDITLAGGSTSSTVILGSGFARDALDSSPCAAVSPAANISSFEKAEVMMRRLSLAKLKVRRGIRRDSTVVGASSQSLNTAPLSSISTLPRPSSLGPAFATSEVAMGNTSGTDERIGSGGTTQARVSPLSDRDPLPHISKYNRITGSTESNNLGKPAVQCSPDGSSSLNPNEAVQQKIATKLKEHESAIFDTGLPCPGEKEPAKAALTDLKNDNRITVPKSPKNPPFLKDKGPSMDATTVSGIKIRATECPPSPVCSHSPISCATNGHLVGTSKRSEQEELLAKNNNSEKDKNTDCAELDHENQSSQRQAQTEGTKASLFTACTPKAVSSLMTSSADSFPFGAKPLNDLSSRELNCFASASNVPHPSTSQGTNEQHWKARFLRLQAHLRNCEHSSHEEYIQMLQSLSSADHRKHAVELETRALKLLVEEGHELIRMKHLNVLGKSVSTS